MGVYKIKETTKEEFVINIVQVKMQCHHFYTTHHATKAVNATVTYRTKHGIENIDMV